MHLAYCSMRHSSSSATDECQKDTVESHGAIFVSRIDSASSAFEIFFLLFDTFPRSWPALGAWKSTSIMRVSMSRWWDFRARIGKDVNARLMWASAAVKIRLRTSKYYPRMFMRNVSAVFIMRDLPAWQSSHSHECPDDRFDVNLSFVGLDLKRASQLKHDWFPRNFSFHGILSSSKHGCGQCRAEWMSEWSFYTRIVVFCPIIASLHALHAMNLRLGNYLRTL